MPKPISETDRCRLFETIAEKTWERIKRAHRYNSDLKETGITADTIVDILEFNETVNGNFDVYAKPGWEENTYGSDLDIFIETNSGQYRWFALQAKLLKNNNRYTTLRDNSDGIMQWDKLVQLEGASGCKAYYLFYNGKSDFTSLEEGNCGRPFTQEQYGCSLIEVESVKNYVERQGSGRFRNPCFESFHPDLANPWRILTCCYLDTYGFNLYSEGQIKGSNRELKLIKADLELLNIEDQINVTDEEHNPITMASKEAGWDPGLRIVIKRTT